MNNTLNLNEEQKKLLQIMLYAIEKRGTFENMATLTDQPLYRANKAIAEEIDGIIWNYDSVFWDCLESLFGYNVDNFSVYDVSDEVEELIKEVKR